MKNIWCVLNENRQQRRDFASYNGATSYIEKNFVLPAGYSFPPESQTTDTTRIGVQTKTGWIQLDCVPLYP